MAAGDANNITTKEAIRCQQYLFGRSLCPEWYGVKIEPKFAINAAVTKPNTSRKDTLSATDVEGIFL